MLLELSHEINYVRWLAGDITSVTGWVSKVSDLEIDVEDTADLVLELESGVTANLHLEMVRRVPVRLVRLVIAGTLRVATEDNTFDVTAGQAVIAPKGRWVRCSTPLQGGRNTSHACRHSARRRYIATPADAGPPCEPLKSP